MYITDSLKILIATLCRDKDGGSLDIPRYYDITHGIAVPTDEDMEKKAEDIKSSILNKLKGL